MTHFSGINNCLNDSFRALKKHGAGLYLVLKRLVFSFNKDSADLLSTLLDFFRQIVNTESMVSKLFYNCLMRHSLCERLHF